MDHRQSRIGMSKDGLTPVYMFLFRLTPVYMLFLFRLTPVYMLILMFYGTLFHYMASGPFYNPYLGDVDGCKQSWWRNLIYINNIWWGGLKDVRTRIK